MIHWITNSFTYERPIKRSKVKTSRHVGFGTACGHTKSNPDSPIIGTHALKDVKCKLCKRTSIFREKAIDMVRHAERDSLAIGHSRMARGKAELKSLRKWVHPDDFQKGVNTAFDFKGD